MCVRGGACFRSGAAATPRRELCDSRRPLALVAEGERAFDVLERCCFAACIQPAAFVRPRLGCSACAFAGATSTATVITAATARAAFAIERATAAMAATTRAAFAIERATAATAATARAFFAIERTSAAITFATDLACGLCVRM